jgi:hypothetical protein
MGEAKGDLDVSAAAIVQIGSRHPRIEAMTNILPTLQGEAVRACTHG